MRIAIVGTGISGLVCARLMARDHEITVFEADSRIGGHSNTVSVKLKENDVQHSIDTGFIVYNERTYPNFTKILADLEVETQATSMSFSVRCDRTGLEYNGTSLNGVYAQRWNLLKPSFHSFIREILRFNREGSFDYETVPEDQTVSEYLAEKKYSQKFSEHYLLPMGAAIWSCPCKVFGEFPIKFILQFYLNHGLLSINNRPVWRTIKGGSREYVSRLAESFSDRIRMNCPVRNVRRLADEVLVNHAEGSESFDEIVFACHSDQALSILDDPSELETELLSAFPYSMNQAVLHTDESVLPRNRRAWASWNYHIDAEESTRPAVTYYMNMLQQIQSSHNFCVTLNESQRIDPEKIIASFNYSHPLFTTERAVAQRRHGELIRHRGTSYCGAYWRNGFHEDGVVSALAVCQEFGIQGWSIEKRHETSVLPSVTPIEQQAALAGVDSES